MEGGREARNKRGGGDDTRGVCVDKKDKNSATLAPLLPCSSDKCDNQRLGTSPRALGRAIKDQDVNAGNFCTVLAQGLPTQQVGVDVCVVRVEGARRLVGGKSEGLVWIQWCAWEDMLVRKGEKRGGVLEVDGP